MISSNDTKLGRNSEDHWQSILLKLFLLCKLGCLGCFYHMDPAFKDSISSDLNSQLDALESVEWKKLVDEHEEKLKELEAKYKAKCESEEVNN